MTSSGAFETSSILAHNEQMKHVATTINNLGLATFGSGVVSNIVTQGSKITWDSVILHFCLWLALFLISTYILASGIVDPDEDTSYDAH